MIMPISASGIGNMDISTSSASKAKQKAEEKAMDAFASLMNMTASNDDTKVMDVQETSDVSTKTDAVEEVTDTYDTKTENKYAVKETDTSSNTNDNYQKTDDNAKVEQVEQKVNTDIEDTTVIQAAEVLQAVEQLIVEELNITPEELDTLLQDMNLSLEDLLNPANMKEFILQLNNSTNVDLLINEDLATLVNDVCAKVENLLAEFEVTDVTEFASLVKEISDKIDEYLNTNTVVNEDEQVVVDDNLVPVTEEASEEVVKVEVTKENQSTNNAENVMKSTEDSDITISDTENNQQTGEFTSKDNSSNAVVNNLNQAIDNAVAQNGVEGVAAYTDAVREADIIRQIIDDIKVHLSKDTTSIEVQLNPENLGKVQISVAAKDGVMQAQIIAETEAAKNAIENSIAVLKENFNNQDLKVEAIEVMVATYDFFSKGQEEQYQENEQSASSTKIGAINLDEGLIEDEISEEEQLQVEIMKSKGNRVSYSI